MRTKLLLILLSVLYINLPASSHAQLRAPPSVTQIIGLLSGDGLASSNNPVTQGLAALVSDTTQLARAIAATWVQVQSSLINLFRPEVYYSYGKSPAVYPSPQSKGDGGWTDAFGQAKTLVSQMTNEEKASTALGVKATNGCSGFTGSVPRLGFPGMCLNDAESGVRTGKLVSGYPAQLHVGAAWNRALAGERAQAIGKEFKAKGINVLLGPVIGPLGRVAKGGRNWEGFSNDPYLAGSLVGPTIVGIQQSVVACVKHFIGNEQETNRTPFIQGFIPGFGNESVSSNIDDRTMHEAYLWPFYDAVKAEVGSVMCSYQKINGSYGCQNSATQNGLLKTELGFEGFIVSDWYAQHTGIASTNAGLDMVMPTSHFLDPGKLAGAVANGSVTGSRLDDMATRILAAWYRFAKVDAPGMRADVDARDAADDQTRFQSAVEGHVLVKNANGALPLNKPSVLNLFGYDAPGGSNTSGLDEILYSFGQANTRAYTNDLTFTGLQAGILFANILPAGTAGPDTALNGTMYTGGGSGAVTPASSISPYDAFLSEAARDNTKLYTDFASTDPSVQSPNDPCLVFVNAASSEAYDRTTLADMYTDTLITNVANKCANTMVIFHNAGIRLVDRWIDHPNITAVIFAHLPGQDSGSALTEIMYGRQSPSGRLPYTVGKSESDYGALLNPTSPDPRDPLYSQSNFTEGLYIDYKHFIQQGIAPRYPFGFGLTYSTFNYSDLSIEVDLAANTSPIPPDATPPGAGPAPQGGLASLYDTVANVSITVANTGSIAAAEVAQLYVGIPDSGLPKVLRGFEKQSIEPGQSARFEFPLRRRDLSIWDTGRQQWVLNAGSYNVQVGKDVEDIVLVGTLTL